jgi:catechol 2,3-dioxygenase-like lactoylglutathione lyase family enzyme
MTALSHVGLCVTDLERSRRFYEEALGFTVQRELRPPDDVTGKLLGVEDPGLTAVYLTLGPFVLELLHFGRDANPSAADRVFNEPGLTHLSLVVEDLPGVLDRVRANGGSVVEESSLGVAVIVRDPDGQRIELLTNASF